MQLPKSITAYIAAFPVEQQMIMALTFKEAQKFIDSDPRRAEALLKAAKFPASALMWL